VTKDQLTLNFNFHPHSPLCSQHGLTLITPANLFQWSLDHVRKWAKVEFSSIQTWKMQQKLRIPRQKQLPGANQLVTYIVATDEESPLWTGLHNKGPA
jgi:hypothetical protein